MTGHDPPPVPPPPRPRSYARDGTFGRYIPDGRSVVPFRSGMSPIGRSLGDPNSVTLIGLTDVPAAAYPRLQGYWGNKTRIIALPGVGTQGTPTKNCKSLRIWPTIFREWPHFV